LERYQGKVQSISNPLTACHQYPTNLQNRSEALLFIHQKIKAMKTIIGVFIIVFGSTAALYAQEKRQRQPKKQRSDLKKNFQALPA